MRLPVLDRVTGHEHVRDGQADRLEPAPGEGVMTGGHDRPPCRIEPREQLGRTGDRDEAVDVGLLTCIEERRLGRGIEVRGDLGDRVGAAAAVTDGEDRLQLEAVALREHAPVARDDDPGVDERAVEVEEDGGGPHRERPRASTGQVVGSIPSPWTTSSSARLTTTQTWFGTIRTCSPSSSESPAATATTACSSLSHSTTGRRRLEDRAEAVARARGRAQSTLLPASRTARSDARPADDRGTHRECDLVR